MTKFNKAVTVAIALFFPIMAAAAETVTNTLNKLRDILNAIIGILFVLVTVWFIWGVVQYVMASGEEAKLKEGKQHMIWGIIGMAVMAGAWGLVSILLQTFGVESSQIPAGPRQNFGF